MRKTDSFLTTLFVIVGVFALIPFSQGRAADNSWPMFQHDAQHTGRSSAVGPGISENPEVNVLIEGNGSSDYFGPPAIGSDGILYFSGNINSQGGVYAFTPQGIQKWYYETRLPGLVMSPVLSESADTLYALSGDGMLALDIENGGLRWKRTFSNENIEGDIVIENNIIYFSTLDSSGTFRRIIALNTGSGDVIWSYDIGGRYGGFAVAKDGTVYYGSGDTIYALNPNGTKKWERRFVPECRYFICNPFVQTPSMGDDGTIYVVVNWERDWRNMQDEGTSNCFHSIDPENPSIERSTPYCSVWVGGGPPTISFGGNVFIRGGYSPSGTWMTDIRGFDSQGKPLQNWSFSSFYGGGSLLITDKEETIYMVSGDSVMAFDKLGVRKFSVYTGPQRSGYLSMSGDGTIYVSGQRKIYAIKPGRQISNLGQFKSDGISSIAEGNATTESAIIFKAALNNSGNNQIKLEIELKPFNQPFNGQDLLTSEFVASGSEITLKKDGLDNGQYRWRARAVDDRGSTSEWREFGETGNADFEVKLVPLYTQIKSSYPPRSEEDEWANLQYGGGNYPDCYSQALKLSTIGTCGCAIVSQVMILRFHGVTATTDGKDVNPRTFNEWLAMNGGYWKDGGVKFAKIQEYSKNESGFARVVYDGPVNFKDNFSLDLYLDNLKPVILYERVMVQGELSSHFIVADGRLADTYTVRDPAWYNTKELNQAAGFYVYNYNNYFYGLRLFSPALALRGVDNISLNLASPAELLVTDPQGRKLGKDPISGREYNEIPDASYYQEGISDPFAETATPSEEHKFIWIPKPLDGDYDIKVIGTSVGSYTLSASISDKNGQSKDIIHTGSTTADNIQGFELDYSSVSLSLPGDVNGDCEVNALDLLSARNKLNQDPALSNNSGADVNGDGKINILDLMIIRNNLGKTCEFFKKTWPILGDANLDCKVNILDLIFVRSRLDKDPKLEDNWQADVNQDGKINALDLIFVRNYLGTNCK